MKRAILAAVLLAASAVAPLDRIEARAAGLAATLEGRVTHVRDGDTIEVGGVAVRLQGLHAPELDEAGGPAAAALMKQQVHGKVVRCDLTGERSHDRAIGICFQAGADIAEALIRVGLGRDCPRFSGGRYAALETVEGRRLPLPKYCRQR